MTHLRKFFVLIFFSVLVFYFSPSNSQSDQVPVDLKPDDSVHVTPSVCMMYHFGTESTDPSWPPSNNDLVEASDGNIYGASPNGGCAACHGMIFRMTPAGQFKIMHVFNDVEGKSPNGGLAKGSGDTFYGTTYGGGKVEYTFSGKSYIKYPGAGTIFSYSAGSESISPIWTFRNGWLRRIGKGDPKHTEKEKKDALASYPVSPPVTNLGGQAMGVTAHTNYQRQGALYSIDGGYGTIENMDGTKAYKLISLTPGVTDNNFYGVSAYGPSNFGNGSLFGTVFKTSGGSLDVLHVFNGENGAAPSNVIQGKDGKLYGTTYAGGDKHGVIYRMNANGSDYKILHRFNNTDGSGSVAALVWGTDNKLYGSTRFGGSTGMGVLFRIDPDGSDYKVLHNFKMSQTGKSPMGNMIQHSDKNFYGTTNSGGRHNRGGIFRLDAGLSKRVLPGKPGGRWCCSLSQGLSEEITVAPIGGPLDPTRLQGHKYGAQIYGDPIGYVYTNRVGLVDIGHVRDMIDLIRSVYWRLMSADRRYQWQFDTPEATVTVLGFPKDQDEILKLAAAITYLDGWSHELTTWDTESQDLSSFSPEDLVSNVVGITIGLRVMRNHCEGDFDKAVDEEIAVMMKELEAQPAQRTREVLDSVRAQTNDPEPGRWYKEGKILMDLVRRNFKVWPWLVPYEYPRYRPGWLTDLQFKPYYRYINYVIKNSVDGRADVTLNDMQRVTNELRVKWVEKNPGMDQWPTNPIGLNGPLNSNPDAGGVPGWPAQKAKE
jgi:uncharacterized repeat protein (TIGR03803 family)